MNNRVRLGVSLAVLALGLGLVIRLRHIACDQCRILPSASTSIRDQTGREYSARTDRFQSSLTCGQNQNWKNFPAGFVSEADQRDLRPEDQPDEAAEFYRLKRAPGGEGPVPVERYLTAREQIKNMPQYSTPLNQTL